MKLKRFILSLLPALALASCSEYDDPADRFTPVEDVKPVRNVLMIEFTGQQCVNCPTAHEQIEEYEKMFGSYFISVSFHGDATMMGIISGPMALGTQDGVAYNKHFGIKTWPSAVVDWTSGDLGSNYGLWITKLIEGMIRPTDLDIAAKASVTADNKISVEVSMRSDKAQSPDAKLMIWLSEDDIVKMQLMPDGSHNMNYVHNNVFRATMCGLYGEQVIIPANAEQVQTRTIDIDPAWVPANMHAVAFVYTESEGVISVVKVPVLTDAE